VTLPGTAVKQSSAQKISLPTNNRLFVVLTIVLFNDNRPVLGYTQSNIYYFQKFFLRRSLNFYADQYCDFVRKGIFA
jgi:hypothetical protein